MDKTRAIFEFIVNHKRDNDGNSPSIREIREGCGISTTSVVHYHLCELERAGWIQTERFQSRSIQVEGGGWVPGEVIVNRLNRRDEAWTL